jgi:hypothetical protein
MTAKNRMGHRDHKLLSMLIPGLIMCLTMAAVPGFGQKGSACPLTDTQSKKAIAAWGKIADFITNEPRCVNCHGGVNPYIDGVGLDPGDTFQFAGTPPSFLEHGGGKQKHENTGVMDQGCKKCHDGMAKQGTWVDLGDKPVPWPENSPLPNWTLAPPFLAFVDKDATTLCRQIKKVTGTATKFLGHLKDDNDETNFAGTAYLGNRGLGDESLEGESVTIQPPSISHAAVMQLGKDWVAAMGGTFQGDEGCGCELTHSLWSGQIHYLKQFAGDEGSNELQDWSYQSLSTVTLTVHNGVGSVNGRVAGKVESQSRLRVATGGGGVTHRKEGSNSSETKGGGTLPLTLDVTTDDASGTYAISLGSVNGKDGMPQPGKGSVQQKWTRCTRDDCKSGETDTPYMPGLPSLSPLSGKLTDRNHIQASYFDKKENQGYSKKGVVIETMFVDLWRTGSSE